MSNRIEIGDEVYCTHAATMWYSVGKIYKVVAHPEYGTRAVQGSDGLYDLLSMCTSKFSKLDPKEETLKIVRE
jgi:hypothetical protein